MGLPEGVRLIPPLLQDASYAGRALEVMRSEENRASFERARAAGHRPVILAISGGGSHGAFGAGMLRGWSEAGDRPMFTVTTGISTGALSAPLACIGPDRDDELETIYTRYATRDLIRRRPVWSLPRSDSLSSTEGLGRVIDRHVDDHLVADLAEAHRNGRRCWAASTDLDSMTPVLWNLGAIAATGAEVAKGVIRDVLRASSAIPGAFSPVRFRVEADGREYDELHVDGGVTSQVYSYPLLVDLKSMLEFHGFGGMPASVYVLRNGALTPDWSPVAPRVIPIVQRSMSAMIRYQGLGDLYRIYLQALRDGIDFNFACIPPDFDRKPREAFDTAYMRDLYELGRTAGRSGDAWRKAPPGYDALDITVTGGGIATRAPGHRAAEPGG